MGTLYESSSFFYFLHELREEHRVRTNIGVDVMAKYQTCGKLKPYEDNVNNILWYLKCGLCNIYEPLYTIQYNGVSGGRFEVKETFHRCLWAALNGSRSLTGSKWGRGGEVKGLVWQVLARVQLTPQWLLLPGVGGEVWTAGLWDEEPTVVYTKHICPPA